MVRTHLCDCLGVLFMLIGVKWHGVLYFIHCAQVSATVSQQIFFFLHISHACTMSVHDTFRMSSGLQTLVTSATDGPSFLGPPSIICDILLQCRIAAANAFQQKTRCLELEQSQLGWITIAGNVLRGFYEFPPNLQAISKHAGNIT
jgi:hypothetical protein